MSSQNQQHYDEWDAADAQGGADRPLPAHLFHADAHPSKVLHVRGVPPYTQDYELHALCVPFGTVSQLLILAGKNQALIQMDSVESAAKVLNYYEQSPPLVQGQPLLFQFSAHQELHFPDQTPASPAQAPAAAPEDGAAPAAGAGAGAAAQQPQGGRYRRASSNQDDDHPNRVLRVRVANVKVPVTVDSLYHVFSAVGTVHKIVTFVKQNSFQALVEMESAETARQVKQALQFRDMYQGCCRLSISYSHLSELTVDPTKPNARDFTKPLSVQQQQAAAAVAAAAMYPAQPYAGAPYGYPAQAGHGAMPAQGGAPGMHGHVVMVHNLVEGKVDCDALFKLFGLYGDVMRVKILFRNQSSAMVEFAREDHGRFAIHYLDDLPVYGQKISVVPSKQPTITGAGADTPLTRDYSRSKFHRYARHGGSLEKRLVPPSPMLFLSNLPDDVTEAELQHLFGPACVAVEFHDAADRRLAFVTMETVGDAVDSLISHHLRELRPGTNQHMRVYFARRSRRHSEAAGDDEDVDGHHQPAGAAPPSAKDGAEAKEAPKAADADKKPQDKAPQAKEDKPQAKEVADKKKGKAADKAEPSAAAQGGGAAAAKGAGKKE